MTTKSYRIGNGTKTLLVVGTLMVTAGCQSGPHAQRGAALGTLAGTATGAVIGHQSGNGPEGAIVGALTGAAAGTLIGDAKDAHEERENAIKQASLQQSVEVLSNYDLVQMAKSGISDEVIINAVRTHGGRFDLSPDGLISLKSNGVSDRVLDAIQTSSEAQSTSTNSTVVQTVRPRVGGVVVLRPNRAVPVRRVGPRPRRFIRF